MSVAPDLTTSVLTSAGAFLAAWLGAYLGFRRSRKERALDRRVGWYEMVIQTLAQYEGELERLQAFSQNLLIVKKVKKKQAPKKLSPRRNFPPAFKFQANYGMDYAMQKSALVMRSDSRILLLRAQSE